MSQYTEVGGAFGINVSYTIIVSFQITVSFGPVDTTLLILVDW
jgi:hypothetical protein